MSDFHSTFSDDIEQERYCDQAAYWMDLGYFDLALSFCEKALSCSSSSWSEYAKQLKMEVLEKNKLYNRTVTQREEVIIPKWTMEKILKRAEEGNRKIEKMREKDNQKMHSEDYKNSSSPPSHTISISNKAEELRDNLNNKSPSKQERKMLRRYALGYSYGGMTAKILPGESEAEYMSRINRENWEREQQAKEKRNRNKNGF